MNLKHLILIAFVLLMPSLIFTQNLDFTFTISNSNCSSDGEITIKVTGGKAPFCYDISSCPNCYTCINQNTYTFKGLPAGNHIITVSDNSVPQQKISKTITIGGNYKLPSIFSTSNKGIVTAIAKDGKRPYQYSISTDNGKTFSTPQSDSIFTGICGKYCVRVIDNCGNFTSYCSEVYTLLKFITNCKELNGNYLVSIDTIKGYPGSGIYKNLKFVNNTDTISIDNPSLKKDYTIKVGCNWKAILEDNCGNIVSDFISCNILDFTINCVNTKDSTLNIQIFSGTPPYKRYYYLGDTTTIKINNSDDFTKVPFTIGKNLIIRVTDNCGNIKEKIVQYLSFNVEINCPDTTMNIGTSSKYTVDFNCTSCTPNKSYKILNGGPLTIKGFTLPYKFTATDTCKETVNATIYNEPKLNLILGCGRVTGVVTFRFEGDNKFVKLSAIVNSSTYRVYDSKNVLIATNNSGVFTGLNVGDYFLEAECPIYGKLKESFSLKPQPLDFRAGITTKKLKNGTCQKVYNVKTVGASLLKIQNITDDILEQMKGTLLPNGTFIGNAYLEPLLKYRIYSDNGCLDTTFVLPSIPAQNLDWERPKCPSEGDLQLSGALPLTWWYDWGKTNAPVIIQNNDNGFYTLDCTYNPFSNPPCSPNSTGKYLGLVPGSKHKAYLYINSEEGSLAKTNNYGPLCPIDSVEFNFKPENYKAPDSITVNYFNCNGQDGTLFLEVKNGEKPYKYQIVDCSTKNVIQEKSDSSNQVTFSNIKNGIYCFIVEDKCGNTIDSKKDQLLAPDFLTKIENVDCDKKTVKLTTSKFNGANYSWSDFKTNQVLYSGNGFSELTTNVLNDSTYILLEIKFNNCVIFLDTILVEAQNKPSFDIKIGNIIDCKANIYIEKIKINEPYKLSWNNGFTTDSILVQNGNWICNLTDKYGCTAQQNINVQINEPVVVIDTVLYENCTGKLNAKISGGTQPFTFIWSTGNTSLQIDSLPNGTYNITTTDANGCKSSTSKNIAINPIPLKIELSNDNDSCSQKLFVSKSSNITKIIWNNQSTKDTIIATSSGSYKLQYIDKNGCNGADSVNININTPSINFTVNQSDTCNTILNWTINGGVAPYKIIWADGQITTTNQRFIQLGKNYQYQLVDNRGCVLKDSISSGEKAETFIIYNAISPNKDGVNDVFYIKGIENFPQNKVSIFNRWGHLIQSYENYKNDSGWKGLWNNEAVPNGTYFYIVELPCQGKIQSGYIEVR